jgi:hypothetical protein
MSVIQQIVSSKQMKCLCSVGIATGYALEGRGSVPGMDKRIFCTHIVLTDSGAHSASYSVSARGSYPGWKAMGGGLKLTAPSTSVIKNGGAIYTRPHASYVVVLNSLRAGATLYLLTDLSPS